jgi:hypothetical protein
MGMKLSGNGNQINTGYNVDMIETLILTAIGLIMYMMLMIMTIIPVNLVCYIIAGVSLLSIVAVVCKVSTR